MFVLSYRSVHIMSKMDAYDDDYVSYKKQTWIVACPIAIRRRLNDIENFSSYRVLWFFFCSNYLHDVWGVFH